MAMVLPRHRDNGAFDSGKYVRYTSEQVEALERVYTECPKPTSLRRQQLIRECPILSNIEPKQIKVWFQNRRCREKQRKESSRLQSVNKKLTAVNKLLMEENDRLQKQVSQLVSENGVMRQQLHPLPSAAADGSCDSAISTPYAPLRDSSNPAGLLSIAEDTLAEFLAKATGTAVDWIQMPGMKPGPDSVGIFAISQTCNGVAARACGLVSLEPTKIAEMLKDRPSWLRDCRTLEIFTMFPSGNGATIELIYSQVYAPTTLAPARDFWTIRYTTTLENGSLVVCERSLSGSGPNPPSSHFVRGEILPSGYLIRPCDGGGSIIHIVDHFNLEAWSVPEVIRPLYESSKIVAQKITIAALRYVRHLAQEASGEVAHGLGRQPAVLRAFSQRLTRGFNDAVCGFNDDGWSSLNCDGTEDIIISIRSLDSLPNIGGIVCAKASMLLQNVPPPILIRFLREHRSEWADFNVDAFTAASLKSGSHARATGFTGSQTIMPLGQPLEQDEVLEVIRLEGHSLALEGAFVCRDVHLLQICSGIDESSVGTCAEMIFAPIDDTFPDDAHLFPSGFRVIPLESKSKDSATANRTLDLASSLEVSNSHGGTCCHLRSVLTIAFQFPFESNLHEGIAMMARQYVRSVISSVQRVAMAVSPLTDAKLSSAFPEAQTLAQWICQSYTYHTGESFLISETSHDDALKSLWQHRDAILCCSLKAAPVFNFANQAGLDMLETTMVGVQDVALDKIFIDDGRKALLGEFAKIMQEGFSYLPGGTCVSTMNRRVAYERCVSWKVHSVEVTAVHCLAFLFVNWSFV